MYIFVLQYLLWVFKWNGECVRDCHYSGHVWIWILPLLPSPLLLRSTPQTPDPLYTSPSPETTGRYNQISTRQQNSRTKENVTTQCFKPLTFQMMTQGQRELGVSRPARGRGSGLWAQVSMITSDRKLTLLLSESLPTRKTTASNTNSH